MAMERRGSSAGRRLSALSTTSMDGGASPMAKSSRVSIAPIPMRRTSRPTNSFSGGRGGGGGLAGLEEPPSELAFETPSPTAIRLRSLARSVRAVNSLGALKVRKRYLASAPMPAAGSVSQPIEQTAAVNQQALGPRRASAATPMSARIIMLPTHEFSTAEMKFRLDPLEPTSPAAGWNVLDVLTSNAQSSLSSPSPTLAHRPSSAALTGGVTVAKNESSTSLAGSNTTSNAADRSSSPKKSRWKTANVKAVNSVHANGGPPTGNNNHNHDITGSNSSSNMSSLRRGQTNSADSKPTKRNSTVSFSSEPSYPSIAGGISLADDSIRGSIIGSHIQLRVNVEARLCCARSLYKLSCQAGCELSIIRGGAISQLAEFSDIDHLHLHELCAATLANLTAAESTSAIDAFVAHDGIPALLELSWSPSITVKLFCATALCRLSSRSAHAAALARARASIEFMSMMSLPSEQLQKLAISCIVNLIFYGHSFPDRIFLGEPHAIQNQLGIMSITTQLALAPQAMPFAAEVLFNLALYRTSCSGVLRGGGAEIIHGLAVHVCKALDDQLPSQYTGSSQSQPPQQQTPRLSPTTAMALLRLIAHTLANFSVHSEFQSTTNGSTMKTLSLLLAGALRDLGSRFNSGHAEERLRILAAPCSRTLVNLSSSDEQRRNGFTPDMVQLTTRLFLVNRSRLFPPSSSSASSRFEEQSFARNSLRAIVNLSFYEPCTAQFMEFPDVMPKLAQIVMGGDSASGDPDNADQGSSEKEKTGSECEYEDDYDDEAERDAVKVTHSNSSSATPTTDNPQVELTEGEGAAMDSEMREDALVAIMNLAQQGAYAHELLKHIDGKRLARAADALARGSRLKYVYDVVLCNILFESRLQQLLYGDLVVNALIDGFYFFAPRTDGTNGASANVDPFNADNGSREALAFHHENLAYPDDQERFLVAIVTIAGEIMDPRNVDRLVALVLDCLRPMDLTMPPATRKWRRHITGYSAAILYTLARSAATRGDVGLRIHDTDTIQALIDICEGKPTAAATAASACDAMVMDVPDLATGRSTTITYCAFAQSFSAATLYHICATGHYTPRVIQALVSACNANEESLSLLACSAAFAIISFTSEGRQQLVACTQLARALNRLGRTSHVECQQYAAIAACNVSTLHCIWSSHELKDFIVVALLRANSLQAKQIHAKTLANLLSHITTRAKAVDDGVLYALMKLSQVMSPPTGVGTTITEPAPSNGGAVVVGSGSSQSPEPIIDEVFRLGLQVLFNLSCDHPYHSKLLGNGVVAFLATAILSDKQSSSSSTVSNEPLNTGASSSSEISSPPLHETVSTDSRRFAMGILCNLSSYETNHKELMHAQVVDILRSYVEDHDVETRASAAMAVRNLSCRQPWVEMICERRTLHMLINFTRCDHAVVRHFAMQALANCSQVTDSLHLFGELKVTRAVLSVLETIRPPGEVANAIPPPSGKSKVQIPTSRFAKVDSRETSMAALICLHNLAFDDALAENMMDETAILRLQPFMETRALDTCEEACTLVATMLSELAGKPRCADALLRQRVVAFCALLHRKHPHNALIAYETCLVLVKMSTYQPIQAMLTETQAIAVVVAICTSPSATTDDRVRECGAIAIRNLALCVAEHDLAFDDDAGFEEDLAAAKIYKAKSRPSPPVADRSRGSGNSRGSHTRRDSSSSVSRLTERHLMQGVQYLQQEIERCLPVRRRRERVGPSTSTTAERILLEACACITNLSTVQTFRLEMVRAGVVSTLLHLVRASVPVPCMVHSMCSVTLHRLALEEDATVDTHGLLVPSLLDILHQSDEELHQVRYECEKVSLPTLGASAVRPQTPVATSRAASSSTAMGESMSFRVVTASTSNPGSTSSTSMDATSSTALLGTTAYLKQTYREPKWITYVVKAMLSSASMVPQIEKKQIRAIGQPKLSFADLDSSSHFVVHTTAPPSSQQQPATKSERDAPVAVVGGPAVADETTATRKGGYLLPVHMDKFTRHLVACLHDGETNGDSAAATGRSIDSIRQQQLSSSRSNVSARDAIANASTGASHDREAIVHSRKFDRHMRLTRRNHRRTKVLPVLSFM